MDVCLRLFSVYAFNTFLILLGALSYGRAPVDAVRIGYLHSSLTSPAFFFSLIGRQ
jgi:hypothetical protein